MTRERALSGRGNVIMLLHGTHAYAYAVTQRDWSKMKQIGCRPMHNHYSVGRAELEKGTQRAHTPVNGDDDDDDAKEHDAKWDVMEADARAKWRR